MFQKAAFLDRVLGAYTFRMRKVRNVCQGCLRSMAHPGMMTMNCVWFPEIVYFWLRTKVTPLQFGYIR